MNRARILLVEDDLVLSSRIKSSLEACLEVEVLVEGRGDVVFDRVSRYRPDMIVLDLHLPGEDGLTLLPRIRAASEAPVLVITGRILDGVQVAALDAGADAFLWKPFTPRDLQAWVEALWRRGERDRKVQRSLLLTRRKIIDCGPLHLDGSCWKATFGGVPVELKDEQFDLLWLLVSRRGAVVTRRDISVHVYGEEPRRCARSPVDMLVSRLRRALAPFGADGWIRTRKEQGYVFMEQEEQRSEKLT